MSEQFHRGMKMVRMAYDQMNKTNSDAIMRMKTIPASEDITEKKQSSSNEEEKILSSDNNISADQTSEKNQLPSTSQLDCTVKPVTEKQNWVVKHTSATKVELKKLNP